MPITALIALAEQYGPTLFGLAMKYGPTLVGLIKQHGPALEAQVGPLIAALAQAGTLGQDVGAVMARLQALAPLLGELGSLGDVADALGTLEGAPVESPAMQHASGSRAR